MSVTAALGSWLATMIVVALQLVCIICRRDHAIEMGRNWRRRIMPQVIDGRIYRIYDTVMRYWATIGVFEIGPFVAKRVADAYGIRYLTPAWENLIILGLDWYDNVLLPVANDHLIPWFNDEFMPWLGDELVP
jgi:hypothetical protein